MNNRILLITALYGRLDLAEIVLKHHKELTEHGLNLQFLAVGSDDECRDLAERCGWDYVHAENKPLSYKFNALSMACEAYDFDFAVLIGSDDLISANLLHYYDKTVKASTAYVLGLTDLYFHSIQRNATRYFIGYPHPAPKTIGAGRVFSRRVMEQMRFKLWGTDKVNRGLDSCCSAELKRKGISEIGIPMRDTGGICCDFKHPLMGLTRFEQVIKRSHHATVGELEKHFGVTVVRQVQALRMDFDYHPDNNYYVRVIDEKLPNFGKVLHVNGATAADLVTRKKAEFYHDTIVNI